MYKANHENHIFLSLCFAAAFPVLPYLSAGEGVDFVFMKMPCIIFRRLIKAKKKQEEKT